MSEEASLSRQSFDEAAARMGINGSEAHMDELYRQVQGVLAGTQSLLAIDVTGVEPDLAFDPSGGQRT